MEREALAGERLPTTAVTPLPRVERNVLHSPFLRTENTFHHHLHCFRG